MGTKNSYLHNSFAVIHRKSILDVQIFTWISCLKTTIPTLSLDDCAKSFLKHGNIDEGELTIEKIKKTFIRIQKESFDEQKTTDS